MSVTELMTEAAAIDVARECLYRFLAAALRDPRTESWRLQADPDNQQLACWSAGLLREEAAQQAVTLGFGELPPDHLDASLLVQEFHHSKDYLCAEYDRVFGLVFSRECPPYETEYQPSAEPFFRAQQLADIAGFYRAFGLDAGRGAPERPDHLALELEFMAFLLLKKRLALASDPVDSAEQTEVCDQAQQTFFREHLAWWVPAFATGLRRKAVDGCYATLGCLLAALVPAERGRLNIPAPRLPVQPALIERPEEQAGCAGCSGQV